MFMQNIGVFISQSFQWALKKNKDISQILCIWQQSDMDAPIIPSYYLVCFMEIETSDIYWAHILPQSAKNGNVCHSVG